MICARGKGVAGEVARILSGLVPPPKPKSAWSEMTVEIGTRSGLRSVLVPLQTCFSETDSFDEPLFVGGSALVFFRDRLFMPERPPKNAAEREEISLRVRKAVYDEDADLAGVRAAVANLEAAIELGKSGPKRELIPEDVKLLVWARDGGACVRCGSKQDLHFDHIIPVAKGGGNSAANIQILCQPCNLRKADKISG
jgi:HNH endonuclease